MILKFIFKTPSNQGIIEKICIRVANSVGVKLGLSRDLNYIYAYVEGDESKIEEFSRNLAHELPLSIFLKSLSAEVSEEFRNDLKRDFPEISLPPCPKCLREVKDENSEHYYDIFHHCEVCGYKAQKIDIENPKKLFEELRNRLTKGDKVSIQTMNGAYEISRNLEEAETVVAKDLASVAKYFMAFEGDAKALASIEKPLVTLKTNLEFKKTYGLSVPAYDVKLPDCMVLELLFDGLDLPLLGLKKTNNPEDLIFEVKTEEIPKSVVTDSTKKDILLYSGDRGVIPKFEKFIKEDIVGKYKNYIAFSRDNKTILDKTDKYDFKNFKEVKPAFGGFYGVLNQWNLEDKNIMGFCFYKEGDSKIFINSPKFGLVEYIDFKFHFNNFEEIFSLIGAMNETGKKLIENFSKKRPELFEKALNADIKSNKKGIYYLWGLIGSVLGFADNVEESAAKLLKYANEAMTKKGPRIDYKLESNNLNPLWAIRTAMSFNLAGVDNYLISYGVIESFAEFLSNAYEQVNKESPLNGAVIVGDLFEGEFLNKIYSYIEKNYPVFTPKALPVSGAVEAYGALVINSKI
ncbi:MAG: hypothetical protein ABGX25_03110 [Nautiliaceae bacterium]